jgi:hypothetical protein
VQGGRGISCQPHKRSAQGTRQRRADGSRTAKE